MQQEASSAQNNDEGYMLDTAEVAVQTETALNTMISVEVKTNLTMLPLSLILPFTLTVTS